MQAKQVFELTVADLEKYPVWYFPMDDSVSDELTIRPAKSASDIDNDLQVIVHTRFTTATNREFVGYLYWGEPAIVQYLRPVALAGDACISFWNGRIRPSVSEFDGLSKADFPIRYTSTECFNLHSINGHLAGIYHFEDDNAVVFKIPTINQE